MLTQLRVGVRGKGMEQVQIPSRSRNPKRLPSRRNQLCVKLESAPFLPQTNLTGSHPAGIQTSMATVFLCSAPELFISWYGERLRHSSSSAPEPNTLVLCFLCSNFSDSFPLSRRKLLPTGRWMDRWIMTQDELK